MGAQLPVKTMSTDEALGVIESGMTIGLGGWRSRRKPMVTLHALLRTFITDLTVVSLCGPATQGVDSISRDGGMRSDVLTADSALKPVESAYFDEVYVAAPVLIPSMAIVHSNRVDTRGASHHLGPCPYFDGFVAMPAPHTFVSTKRFVPTENLTDKGSFQTLRVPRMQVSAVVETPRGAHLTACAPICGLGGPFQRQSPIIAKDPQAQQVFKTGFLGGDEGACPLTVENLHFQQEEE